MVTFFPYSFTDRTTVTYTEDYERYVEGRNGPVLECGGTARGSGVTTDGRLNMYPVLLPGTDAATVYGGEASARLKVQLPGCENESEDEREFVYFSPPDGVKVNVQSNGRLITGRWTEDCSDELEECTTTYTWQYTSKPQQ